VKLKDTGSCLICGKSNPIGLKLAFRGMEGHAETSVVIPENFQGWGGMAHGGMVTALLDEAMFYALAGLGWSGVTAEITVRFIAPVPTEEALHLEGEVEARRGRFGRAAAWLRLGEKTLAEARGKFLTPAE